MHYEKIFLDTVLSFLGLITLPSNLLAHVDVTPEQAKEMIDTNPELLIVDVREESEFCSSGGHIPVAATTRE